MNGLPCKRTDPCATPGRGSGPAGTRSFRLLRGLLLLLPAAVAAGGIPPAAAAAQETVRSKTLERIAREQQNIRYRLERILEKMDRLVKRNELEGKQHTADLIRRARAEIEKRNLVKRIEALDARIRAAQLNVEEEQRAVLRDLEDIFAILQDRSDMERIQDLLNAYVDGLNRLESYLDEQDAILEETRKAAFDPAELLRELRERVKALLEGQKALNRDTAEAAENRSGAGIWSVAEELQKLAEELEARARENEASSEQGAEPSTARALAAQREIAGRLDKAREALAALARTVSGEADLKKGVAEARKGVEGAQRNLRIAEARLEQGERKPAAERQREAAEALADAAAGLRRAGERAFQARRRGSRALGERQDKLRREMSEVAEKLKRLEALAGKSGEGAGGEAAKGEEILGEMEAARDRLEGGEAAAARPHQERAGEGLDALRRSLESRNVPEGGRGEPGARKQAYRDLAQRQQSLEKKVRELMRRLRELPDEEVLKHLAEGADKMAGASEELRGERGKEAEQEEEEARKALEEARKRMTREENKYRNIQQQEVLFRVQQVLEALKVQQDKVNLDTAAFDGNRPPDGRLSRLKRRMLEKLVAREEEIRSRTLDVKEKIGKDASTVFSWVLERNAADLDTVAGRLRKRETGALVQLIQADVSKRFGELIEALKVERQRRMQAETEPSASPAQGGSPQRQPLIPPVAELIMVKKMEENALADLEEFLRRNPELLERPPTPGEARLLEHLGHRHATIHELFEKMIQRAQGAAPAQER